MSVFWKKVPILSIPRSDSQKDPFELNLIYLISVLPDFSGKRVGCILELTSPVLL